jgi:asparagine synthase (glutamine-hydrolysing)
LIGPQQAAQATLALPDALDEPLADAAALPTWWLCRSARPDFKAVLSGAGADELLGGYPWHAQPTHSPHQSARALFQPDQLAWLTRSPELRQHLLPTKVLRGQEIERFDQDVYLVSDILTLTDRVAMAHGLEVRLPYLNGSVIACCRHLEGPLRSNKLGLRKALQGLLPEAILGRKKQGFVPPLEDWMWQEGPLRQAVLAPLEEPQLVEQGWLEAGAIRRLLEEHDRRLGQHGRRLWGLYLLEMWLRQNTS